MCCLLGALLIAVAAAWRRWFGAAATNWRRGMPAITAAMAMAVILISGAALAVEHLGHYAKRAHANQRGMLAEMLAQPICSGAGWRLRRASGPAHAGPDAQPLQSHVFLSMQIQGAILPETKMP